MNLINEPSFCLHHTPTWTSVFTFCSLTLWSHVKWDNLVLLLEREGTETEPCLGSVPTNTLTQNTQSPKQNPQQPSLEGPVPALASGMDWQTHSVLHHLAMAAADLCYGYFPPYPLHLSDSALNFIFATLWAGWPDHMHVFHFCTYPISCWTGHRCPHQSNLQWFSSLLKGRKRMKNVRKLLVKLHPVHK